MSKKYIFGGIVVIIFLGILLMLMGFTEKNKERAVAILEEKKKTEQDSTERESTEDSIDVAVVYQKNKVYMKVNGEANHIFSVCTSVAGPGDMTVIKPQDQCPEEYAEPLFIEADTFSFFDNYKYFEYTPLVCRDIDCPRAVEVRNVETLEIINIQ